MPGTRLYSVPAVGAEPSSMPPEKWEARLPRSENAWRTGQLNDAGLNSEALRALVERGTLVRARFGCYVRGTFWRSLDPAGRERINIFLHAHTAVARERGRSVYSHTSAARLHGLPLWKADSYIHLTRKTKNSSQQRAPDVKLHCLPLADAECTVIDGLPVTNPLRTTVDCALTFTYKQALILMDNALRSGIPRDLLEREAAGLDGHRGIRIFRAALDFASADSESAGESLSRHLISVCNLPAPVLQYGINTPQGSYRADFAWPEYKVILEFDGEGKYFNYRPTDQVLRDERRRENALIELGWTVVRIGWRDLFNEHLFKTRLLAALHKGGMK